jgi:hypothetical protein
MSDHVPRFMRLQTAIDVADELSPLDGPSVKAWFDAYEARLCREMIDAAPADDEARRNAALKAWALRELRAYVRNAIDDGRRAPKEIEKLRHQK